MASRRPWWRNGPRLTEEIPCGYCFQDWATCYDHILPVSHGGTRRKENLYPSCQRCNAILHNKVFDSLDDKRAFIRQELIERGEWSKPAKVLEVSERLPTKEEVAEVLQPPLPLAKLGKRKSSRKKKRHMKDKKENECGLSTEIICKCGHSHDDHRANSSGKLGICLHLNGLEGRYCKCMKFVAKESD